jgi:hypothetical protein
MITFTNKRIAGHHNVNMNGIIIPYANTAKYLGMTLQTKLKRKEHVKKKEVVLKYKKMYWLIGRNSQLSIYRCPKNGVLTVHYGVEETTVNVRKMFKKFYWP